MLITLASSLMILRGASMPMRFSGDMRCVSMYMSSTSSASSTSAFGNVAGAVERMGRWEVHAVALIVDRSLQRIGQLRQQLHAIWPCATRPATITGFSAFTSIFASSAMAPESPTGESNGVEYFGIRRSFSSIGSSCSLPLAMIATGPMGGVMAILYARTNDSAKCCSEAGYRPTW